MNDMKAKVLFVGDDCDLRKMCRLLNNIHCDKYIVECISDYDEAVMVMQKNEHDLYLIDDRVGTKNGLDLIREFSSNGYFKPIVFLMDGTNMKLIIEAVWLEIADFLDKGHVDAMSLERSLDLSFLWARMEHQEHPLFAS